MLNLNHGSEAVEIIDCGRFVCNIAVCICWFWYVSCDWETEKDCHKVSFTV